MPENLRYIRYNLLTIGNSLMEAFKLATSAQTRSAVALTLARLGYVSDHEFHRWPPLRCLRPIVFIRQHSTGIF